MEAPLVSVLSPTYNHERFIASCIESVLSQSFSNWEQIIIDDGSQDRTPEIVQHYNDTRIRYIWQEHHGIERLGETYNLGLRKARGRFIAILEGDDLWPPYKLEAQLHAFESEDVVFSYGPVELIDMAGRRFEVMKRFPKDNGIRFNSPPGTILKELLFTNFIPSVSVVLRRSALERIGGFQQPFYCKYVDYPTWLELSLLGRFNITKDIVGYYRRYRKQATFQSSYDILTSGRRCALDFVQKALAMGRISQELVSLETLKEYSQGFEEYAQLVEGRRLLLEKRWTEARSIFTSLVKARWTRVRLLALFGFWGSLLHFNIEPLFRLFGFHSWSRE